MKYPFKNYKNPERFLEEIEANPSGHYPIGISSFWHSGIHIYSSTQKEFSPILNGSVVCYRISESYKQVQLPQVLSKDDLNDSWSEYKDLYEKGNTCKIKSENNSKTYSISDCFIMLQHEVTLDKKKYIFYTLYTNLAPKCDYPEYNKNFIIDGKIHGSAINTSEKEFLIDIIGKPAKKKKEIYFDYILLSNENLKTFSSKNGIKDFWNIDKNTKFYTRTKSSTETPEKIFIPKWTEIDSEEFTDGDEKAYKITIKSVQVYLNSSQVKNNILKDISSLTFSRGSDLENILAPTNNQKFISELIKQEVFALKDKKVDYQPRETFQYIKVYPKQPIIFWTKEKITTIELQGKDPLYKYKYNSNPLQYKYQLQNNIPEEIKKNVINISDTKLQGSDNQNYYQLIFNDNIDEEYYINEVDKNRSYKPLLDFDNWLYFCKESNSIICDKTELIKDVINTHDNLVKTALLLSPIIGIWWTGAIITWDFLKYIFGIKSKTKESQGGDLTKKELRKVICRHPIEFNKEQFKDISKKSKISKEAEQNLVNESTAIDLWSGGLEKIFTGNPYYANPIFLINHFEKANLFEFNPYKNETITPRFKKGNDPDIVVSSNPGFAPAVEKVSTVDDKARFVFQKKLNGIELYWATVNYDYGKTEGYGDDHSGIDLAGYEGTNIYALINGVVLSTTYQETVDNTYDKNIHCYGRMMLIYGDNNKLYLLGHLSKFKKKEGEKIQVGDIVAEVGNTGYSKGAHLHLEVFSFSDIQKYQDILFCSEGENINNHSRNILHKNDGGKGTSKENGLQWAKTFNNIRGTVRKHPLKH